MKEKPQYSYRDGKTEAVMFVFRRDNQLLIEHRFDKEPPEPYIPNGSIEMKDKIVAGDKGDYREVALRREIDEEFNGKITPMEFKYLSEFTVEQRKINFLYLRSLQVARAYFKTLLRQSIIQAMWKNP